jgi:hypothetical protein
MAYIDPIELLQLTVPGTGDLADEDIRRAKRKLLAEFELSGQITIRYRGGEIDKSTALQAVEALEDPTQRAHYVRLHRHRELQEFLREPRVKVLARVPASNKLGDAAYIKFISERLVPIYLDLLGGLVRRKDWVSVALLLNRLDLLDSWQHDTVLKPFINHIRLCNRQLNEVNESTSETWKQLWDDQLIDVRMMEAMNRLPRNLQEQRNQYARILANVAIHSIDPIKQVTLAHLIIVAADKLDVDTAAKDRVTKVRAWVWSQLMAFRAATDSSSSATSGSTGAAEEARARSEASSERQTDSRRIYFWLALILSVVALSLRFCNSTHTTEYTSYLPPSFQAEQLGKLTPKVSFDTSLFADLRKLDSVQLVQASQDNDIEAYLKAYEATRDSLKAEGGNKSADVRPTYQPPRLDTIFFRDLIFYETLNGIQSPPAGSEAASPRTGSSPYKGNIRPPRAPWDKKDDPEKLLLSNRSSHGAIFFLESLSGGQILYHYYLAPGDKHLLPALPTAFYMVRVYHGLDFRDNCATYRGNPIPAFTRETGTVATGMDRDDQDLPGVMMLYHSKAFYFDGPAPVKELILGKDFVLSESK